MNVLQPDDQVDGGEEEDDQQADEGDQHHSGGWQGYQGNSQLIYGACWCHKHLMQDALWHG